MSASQRDARELSLYTAVILWFLCLRSGYGFCYIVVVVVVVDDNVDDDDDDDDDDLQPSALGRRSKFLFIINPQFQIIYVLFFYGSKLHKTNVIIIIIIFCNYYF